MIKIKDYIKYKIVSIQMNCKEKINKTIVGASVIYSGAFSKNVGILSKIVGVTDSGNYI